MNTAWTPSTLKEYLDSHLAAVHAEINTRFGELHREHDKFEQTVKDGFVKQNEFRGSLEDLGKTMATRREMEALEETLVKRLSRTETWQAKIGGGLLLVGLLLPTVLAIILYFTTHR